MGTERTEPRPILLTVEEAAKLLRIGRSTLYELLATHEIAHVKIGRSTRVVLSDLDRWVQEQTNPERGNALACEEAGTAVA